MALFDTSLWNKPIANQSDKERAARGLAEKLKPGQVVGVGSGSTSFLALLALAERRDTGGITFSAIPTSLEIAAICLALKVPVVPLGNATADWSFDGADEVDASANLIKGRGGALFREKLLMKASKQVFIIVDASKRVRRLGEKFDVPVEVHPQALNVVEPALRRLPGAAEVQLRAAAAKDGPVITENGNLLVDVRFDRIAEDMETHIKSITGVIESGLFMGYNPTIISSD